VAIKGGDLIHVANRILVDRAQTAGPGQVNINKEKIYELGNYYSLASLLDTPDLTFSLESFDASAEFEALLTGNTYQVDDSSQSIAITGTPTGGTYTLTYAGQTTAPLAYNANAAAIQAALLALSNISAGDLTVTGTGPYVVVFIADSSTLITGSGAGLTGGTTPAVTVVSSAAGTNMADGFQMSPAKALPIDVASAFKPGFTAANPYDVVGSVGIPFLQLETLSYRFGISENAQQSATFRGDSVFYSEGSTFVQVTPGTNAANQAVVLTNPATVYHGDTTNSSLVDGVQTASTRYVLSVTLKSGKRLLPGADYTESTATGVTTVTVLDAVPTTDAVRVMYASPTATTYPQLSHAAVTAVRPAAIRGRNVEIYIGGSSINDRWTSVQSVSLDYRVTLNKDEELGNSQVVSQDFDVPDVTGSIDLKPRDYAELYAKICQTAGVTPGEVAGALTTTPLELLIVLHSPDTGAVLKTLEVPDARFTLPGYSGRAGVGQKLTVTFSFESDTGAMFVYKGARP
jgi:hypothetical protein